MSNNDRPFSWPWFILGCFLLLAAFVAFFWSFALGELTHDRRMLLMWILPLASGFACGCFSGSVSTSGKVGLAVTATGGFAVWIAFDKGTSFRQGAEIIAKREGFSVDFTCPEQFLSGELSTDTMMAKGPHEVLEKLGSKVIDASLRRKYRVLRSTDKGIYEIRCE